MRALPSSCTMEPPRGGVIGEAFRQFPFDHKGYFQFLGDQGDGYLLHGLAIDGEKDPGQGRSGRCARTSAQPASRRRRCRVARAVLPPPGPLRTVRESFPSYGSSLSEPLPVFTATGLATEFTLAVYLPVTGFVHQDQVGSAEFRRRRRLSTRCGACGSFLQASVGRSDIFLPAS